MPYTYLDLLLESGTFVGSGDPEDLLPLLTPLLDIYFLQNDAKAKQAALDLRDAVLRLRRDGAFVAGEPIPDLKHLPQARYYLAVIP